MTASEAIKIINGIEEVRGELPEDGEDVEIALMMAKDALSEVEQYRAIGTAEELQKMKDDYAEAITDWRQYKKIGTIEHFRELTEKAEPKKMAMKPLRDYDSERDANWCSCPNCFRGIGWEYERHFNFCNECGTEFDWE